MTAIILFLNTLQYTPFPCFEYTVVRLENEYIDVNY